MRGADTPAQRAQTISLIVIAAVVVLPIYLVLVVLLYSYLTKGHNWTNNPAVVLLFIVGGTLYGLFSIVSWVIDAPKEPANSTPSNAGAPKSSPQGVPAPQPRESDRGEGTKEQLAEGLVRVRARDLTLGDVLVTDKGDVVVAALDPDQTGVVALLSDGYKRTPRRFGNLDLVVRRTA